MISKRMGRREFIGESAVLAAGLAAGFAPAKTTAVDRRKILNFNVQLFC